MSILLGSATFDATTNTVVIQSPTGQFGGIKAVRLSNYTGDALIITNVTEMRPGQEYLMPFQQNVYQQINVQNPPQISAIALGTNFDVATLLVEWSTEPLEDFPGTYPTALTEAALGTSGGSLYTVNAGAVESADGDVIGYSITQIGNVAQFMPAPGVLSTTVVNMSANIMAWGVTPTGTSLTGRGIILKPDDSLTFDNGAPFTIHFTDATTDVVGVFGTAI